MSSKIDLDNPEFQTAWNLLEHTRRSVFLTGKAGTGKSTFLRWVCQHTKKKYVVLAPTGIAAVNVHGQTMHSFFKIPLKPLMPDDPTLQPRQLRKTLRYNSAKLKLIRKLDLIIIDEISMVRCDVIDFINKVLCHVTGNHREPFGGKQMLLVGDIFQLEPVVTRDVREILSRHYRQFFFFNALAFQMLPVISVELRKIYRQSDSGFVAMLDRIRVNRASNDDINAINDRYDANYDDLDSHNGAELVMTLATRRDTVDAINQRHLEALKTEAFTYQGTIEGDFNEKDLPTSLELTLKVGAQVLFVKNDMDGRWVNGTIAKVSEVAGDHVTAVVESGEEYRVAPETWENVQYSYDEKEHKVIENVVGTFTQYPLKPAWALTVHKSQGLTFSRVIIDFSGGAFTGGQTYVALSRCTSLEGIKLVNQLSQRDIMVNPEVVKFSKHFNDNALINDALNDEKANALFTSAVHAFNANDFGSATENFIKGLALKNPFDKPLAVRFLKAKLSKYSQLSDEIKSLEEALRNKDAALRALANEYTEMACQSIGSPGGSLNDIDLRAAMANFDKALRIAHNHVPAMIGKARLYIMLGEHLQAEALLDDALRASGSSYDALMAKGELLMATHDKHQALKVYQKAAVKDKKRWEPIVKLAEIYEDIGLDELAESYREAAKKIKSAASKSRKKKK